MIYVDNLSLWSLFGIFMSRAGVRVLLHSRDLTIHYFTSSALADRLVFLLGKGMPLRCQQLDYSLIDLRDVDGASTFSKINHFDSLEITNKCSRKELEHHPLVLRFGRRFANQRLIILLKRRLDLEMRPTLLRINVLDCLHRNQPTGPEGGPTLYAARSPWSQFLKEYGSEHGVTLRTYRNLALPQIPIERRLAFLIRFAKVFLSKRFKSRGKFPSAGVSSKASPHKFSVIATPFDGDGVTLDPGQNSDLFWFPFTGAAPGQVLLYCWTGIDPLDEDKVANLENAQIRYVAMNRAAAGRQHAPVWTPSFSFAAQYAKLAIQLGWQVIVASWRGPRLVGWLVPKFLDLVLEYAYWSDFFKTYKVKVHLCRPGRRIVAEQALTDLGGISATYQRSHQFFVDSHSAYSADVHFSFGSQATEVLERSGASAGQVVAIGYPKDCGFAAVRSKSTQLRDHLKEKGAGFILCFLDENSAQDKRGYFTHEHAAENYRYLFRKLQEDPSLGLVLKPKKPNSLRQRLGDAADLLDAAVASGRCHVFDSGGVNSYTLPCEASLAADVTIGLLVGATATLESRLAGTPSVLLDREHVPTHPLYVLGHGSVIFQGWDELWNALQAFRLDPDSARGFGEWLPYINSVDPYRDGRAAERMGNYLGWLADGLQEGLPRQEVLDQARRRYTGLWGEDMVISLNGSH